MPAHIEQTAEELQLPITVQISHCLWVIILQKGMPEPMYNAGHGREGETLFCEFYMMYKKGDPCDMQEKQML